MCVCLQESVRGLEVLEFFSYKRASFYPSQVSHLVSPFSTFPSTLNSLIGLLLSVRNVIHIHCKTIQTMHENIRKK